MSGGGRDGSTGWKIAGVIAVTALIGAVIHLHGKIGTLEHKIEAMDGRRDTAAVRQRPEQKRAETKPRGEEKALKAARLEAMLSSAARTPPRDGEPDKAPPRPHDDFLEALGRDVRNYSPAQLARIDDLYRKGGEAGIETEKGRAALEELVEEFPESNRGGCAASNLGAYHLNQGELEAAAGYFGGIIESGSSAVFASGEKVLPRALLNYGEVLERQGDTEGALAAWRRVAEEFADEVDGEGVSYGDLVAPRL